MGQSVKNFVNSNNKKVYDLNKIKLNNQLSKQLQTAYGQKSDKSSLNENIMIQKLNPKINHPLIPI